MPNFELIYDWPPNADSPPGGYGDVNALGDGVRLSVTRSENDVGIGHLYIVDVARGAFTRLNPGVPNDFAAAVAPDHLVAFSVLP